MHASETAKRCQQQALHLSDGGSNKKIADDEEGQAITAPSPTRDLVTMSCQSSSSISSNNNVNEHVNTLAEVEEHPEPSKGTKSSSRSLFVPAHCFSSDLFDCDSMNGKGSPDIAKIEAEYAEGVKEVYYHVNDEPGNCSRNGDNFGKEI